MVVENSEEILLQGMPISEGIAIGIIYFPQVREESEVLKFAITADQIDREIERYRKAIALSRADLEHLEFSLHGEGLREAARIIEVHLEMLNDPFLTVEMEGKVRKEKCNVESIFRSTMNEFALRFPKKADTFFQQRLVDVMDVSNRILGHLNKNPHRNFQDAPEGCIAVATDLDSSSAASAHAKRISAFITASGSTGSHAALIARSRGIPYVGMTELAPLFKFNGRLAIVDGGNGTIILNPQTETLANYRKKQWETWLLSEKNGSELEHPAETVEGQPIRLMVNIGSLDEIDLLDEIHAEGIGLLRSEFLFADERADPLAEETQFACYRQVIQKMKNRPMVIRLFDFGGDKKPLGNSFSSYTETNPLLGCRGIRYLFRHPMILRNHVRSLLRSAIDGDVRLLVPFVSQVEEMRKFRAFVRETSDSLKKEHIPHRSDLPIGCMLEVPSALLLAEELSAHSDFFCLGTNDLTQYVLGIDRVNPSLEAFYQPIHPSVLRLMHWGIVKAKQCRRPISICGEMASQPLFLPLLLGLGLEDFSVVPRSFLSIKKQIRNCSLLEAHELAKRALELEDPSEVFQVCWKFSEALS